MNAIKHGLHGISYSQLSRVLMDEDDDINAKIHFGISKGSKRVSLLRSRAQEASNSRFLFFSSDYIHEKFTPISGTVFDLQEYKFNIKNATQSVHEMNEWLSGWVQEPIGTIFHESILCADRLIFMYTFKFHADWITNFDPKLTKNETFYDDKGKKLIVSMMNQKSKNRIYDSPGSKFRILFKTCQEGRYHSAVVLPNEGTSVQEVLNRLPINQIVTYYKNSAFKEAHVKMPKFKIFARTDLVETLKLFGITYIFERNQLNFRKIMNHNVFIGNITQISNLVVDETGSTEPSPTKARVDQAKSTPYEFYVKRPFLFFVFSYAINIVYISAVVTNPNDA
ncbi:Glia-derived nexin [Thelohanellus kitauei]|uniref:Glia-derived nexin n=1 Tax=Thelohanellus kitauei TaxID=669202 RepID=A0A0C2IAA5_THEKT|nr:Glia-derived nexin [Thelohanellus kitauei]